MSLGTPSYMSPEQASGDPAVDGRSDTYALGCVVYEMLCGHPPFLGTTTQEILARHLRDPVPPIRSVRPDLPASVEDAVGKALAKAPEDRFATASEFAAALNRSPGRASLSKAWMRIAAAVAVLLGGGYGLATLMNRPPATEEATTAAPSIAVLPFANVNGDSANAPFSDGVADEVTTALGRVGGLRVLARASAFSFRRSDLDPLEIGRRLGVRFIVTGRVRSADARRRIGAELVDVSSGNEIWSDTFDGDVGSGDVFAIQDSITRSIVRQVLPRITGPALSAAVRRPTVSPVAHDLYLQGRYFFERRDSTSLTRAQEYFGRAIAADSSYALAYAGLADAYSHQSVFGHASPAVNFPLARAAAERALALDSTSVEVHTSRGFIALFGDWDYPAAGRAFERAIAIDPRYAPAHLFRAWYLVAMDSLELSLAEARLALTLDPFSSVIGTRLVTFLYYNRRYQEAADQATRVAERDSLFIGVLSERTRALAFAGRCDEALEQARKPGVDQATPQIYGVRGVINAMCGRRTLAQARLDSLVKSGRAGRKVSHYGLASMQAALGHFDQVQSELNLAREAREWPMFTIKADPVFDVVRAEPWFSRLLVELRLPL
jgi:serine/threonine-protein kinase